MLHNIYKTRLFTTYIPLAGVVYFTSLLFHMANTTETRQKLDKLEKLDKIEQLEKSKQLK